MSQKLIYKKNESRGHQLPILDVTESVQNGHRKSNLDHRVAHYTIALRGIANVSTVHVSLKPFECIKYPISSSFTFSSSNTKRVPCLCFMACDKKEQ